jgi:hypothetical protein
LEPGIQDRAYIQETWAFKDFPIKRLLHLET